MKKIILGAGKTKYDGWISTNLKKTFPIILDATKESDWKKILGTQKASNIMSEHVWEHIKREDIEKVNKLCYDNLEEGGRLRIAVPDGNCPDQEYIDNVKPNGKGVGCDDHHILYTKEILTKELKKAGFKTIKSVEYWDKKGKFHKSKWSDDDGHIMRSADNDKRNINGVLKYTSLIIDAIK